MYTSDSNSLEAQFFNKVLPIIGIDYKRDDSDSFRAQIIVLVSFKQEFLI